jgi:hypothetical protein
MPGVGFVDPAVQILEPSIEMQFGIIGYSNTTKTYAPVQT